MPLIFSAGYECNTELQLSITSK